MTPAQQTALAAELKNDPLALGYAAHMNPYDETSLLALLNAPNYSLTGSVTTGTLLSWLAETGLMAIVEDTANTPGSTYYATPLRSAALSMLKMLGTGIVFDLSGSTVGKKNVAMLAAWVTANALSTTDRDALLALAAVPSSRVEVLGIGPASELDLRSVVFADNGTKVI